VAAFLETIMRLKPSASKGSYLKGMAVSTTMGPGIKVDMASVKDLFK
jgi:large subunit ribosomal protein L1